MTVRPKKDFAVAVRENRVKWPEGPPDWILVLAERSTAEGQSAVARRLGVSGSMVCQILAGRYPADTTRVADLVRGAYMGAAVCCPWYGREIGIDKCAAEQRRPYSSASPMAARFARVCGSCPHNLASAARGAENGDAA